MGAIMSGEVGEGRYRSSFFHDNQLLLITGTEHTLLALNPLLTVDLWVKSGQDTRNLSIFFHDTFQLLWPSSNTSYVYIERRSQTCAWWIPVTWTWQLSRLSKLFSSSTAFSCHERARIEDYHHGTRPWNRSAQWDLWTTTVRYMQNVV